MKNRKFFKCTNCGTEWYRAGDTSPCPSCGLPNKPFRVSGGDVYVPIDIRAYNALKRRADAIGSNISDLIGAAAGIT